MGLNDDLTDNLKVLVLYYKQQRDQWRVRAYTDAIIALEKLPYKITDISQVTNIRGIGAKTLAKINEFLITGKIKKVEEFRSKIYGSSDKDIAIISGVWGIGPAKARELYDNGIRNIKTLRAQQEHLRLTKNQRIGLKYYEELQKKIPRSYIDVFKMMLHIVLSKTFGVGSYQLAIAGSYRRGKPESGDIDCLITSTEFDLSNVVDVLVKWNIITDMLGFKQEKFMGIAHCPDNSFHHFRLDIEFLPASEWGSGLLYFTGSQSFNIALRSNAKKQGYTLNQHGLFKEGVRIPVYTEEEIMNYLGLEYVHPSER